MLSSKNSLTAFYAKFMTPFDVFYSNVLRSEIVRVFYIKFRTHLRCFSSRFTMKSFEPEPSHDRLHAISTPYFGPCLLLQNRYRIYDKFHTHLRCFRSRFTLESIRDRTRARSAARDFHAVFLGPVCCYKTDIGFTLNFVLIYVVLAHVLRWNPPSQNQNQIGRVWIYLTGASHTNGSPVYIWVFDVYITYILNCVFFLDIRKIVF
jgi:hypothetical protein